MKGLLNALTIGLTLLLSGCAGAILVGAGVGAFSYVAGSLVRVYEAEYQLSIAASITVMTHFNFKQKEESQNGLKTIVEGYLDGDTPVTIEVVYVDTGWTQIGVRTGYIGSANLEISKQVHTDIANELERLKSLNPPPTLHATSRKKKVDPAEAEPGVSHVGNDPASPPSKTFTTSTAGTNEDPLSSVDRQEKQTLSHAEKRQDETDQFAPEVDRSESDGQSPLSEPVSTPSAIGMSTAQNLAEGKENQALSHTEKRQDETGPYAPEVDRDESDGRSPLSEPVSTPSASDMSAAQNVLERQENQALSQAESKSKTFYYDPKSALTIHSGSYDELDEVISYLERNPSTSVDIRAYTNSEGTASRAISLARKRVFEIREYLILNGISEDRITAQRLGENTILDSNSTGQLESLNHPVELTVR